jgi:hypothetical protein
LASYFISKSLCQRRKGKDHADQAILENMGAEGPAEKTSKFGLDELVAWDEK